ncbi:hypothetical protein B4U15_07330 [Klebsiella pneumoniae]|nr:hypothetical protein CS526_11440 [Klebsiella pneumoniae]ATR24148.1 hypothetical protein CTI59_04735 [Klebsiella pneumoniae]ATR30950.1 hypothetical protein CTI61_11445 [Klebsiella pneumoniae]ATR36481.1 hypothetical protein CTI62_11265 [Klebsiella pneumoniae]ATR57745.1 hypothetical protein CTI74_11430 [Klebsiella pneumoniae]
MSAFFAGSLAGLLLSVGAETSRAIYTSRYLKRRNPGNDSNLLIVFYVQIMPDDFVMQLHRF